MTYSPRGKNAEILRVGLELVNAAPYRVSTRWAFYRLLQLGYYSGKSDYKDKFLKVSSDARHARYNGWRPDSLADETREAITRGIGPRTMVEWLEAWSEQLHVNLDMWANQDCYLELWYEARAMTQQFEHYTRHITLRPMGGQPSIDYKYQTAQDLDLAAARYRRPIVILYFGDLDWAGGTISNVVERDVRTWCKTDFEFVRCGLTEAQVRRYKVPENPEKPGEFQWEALSDEGARDIITEGVGRYLRHDAFRAMETRADRATTWVRQQLADLAQAAEALP